MTQAALFDDGNPWRHVERDDGRARALVDGELPGLSGPHYSRQTPGAHDFMAAGRTFVLLTDDGLAVWGVIDNLDPRGGRQFRCTVFRNEGPRLSSDLIRIATRLTLERWRRWPDHPPLRTEVDPRKVRRKRDPGRCFRKAGWIDVGKSKSHRHRGAIVLEAPPL